MGKRVNRYRLTTPNLKMEKSLSVSVVEGKTDKEIALMILRLSKFYRTAKDIEEGNRTFTLKLIR